MDVHRRKYCQGSGKCASKPTSLAVMTGHGGRWPEANTAARCSRSCQLTAEALPKRLAEFHFSMMMFLASELPVQNNEATSALEGFQQQHAARPSKANSLLQNSIRPLEHLCRGGFTVEAWWLATEPKLLRLDHMPMVQPFQSMRRRVWKHVFFCSGLKLWRNQTPATRGYPKGPPLCFRPLCLQASASLWWSSL